jgi:undecaprenyl-diphosphatase
MILSDYVNLIYEWIINLPIYVWIITIFLISFTDSIFSPIPPDPLLIISTTYHSNYLWLFIFICILASYLGGIVSYLLANKIYSKYALFIHKFINKEKFEKINIEFSIRGNYIILLCAITFIPFKVIAWVAGFLEYDFSQFSIFSILGRAVRYSLLGILCYVFGENIKSIIETSLTISNYLAILLLIPVILFLVLWIKKNKFQTNL